MVCVCVLGCTTKVNEAEARRAFGGSGDEGGHVSTFTVRASICVCMHNSVSWRQYTAHDAKHSQLMSRWRNRERLLSASASIVAGSPITVLSVWDHTRLVCVSVDEGGVMGRCYSRTSQL